MRNPILKFRQSSIVFKKPGFLFQKFRHGFSPVNLLHIFRTPFLKNISEWLLLTVVLHQICDEKHVVKVSIEFLGVTRIAKYFILRQQKETKKATMKDAPNR